MTAPKHPSELINNPVFLTKQQPDPPVSTAMDHLTTLDGDELDIMCNVDSTTMAGAIGFGAIYADYHGSAYVRRTINLLKRLSNSKEALARKQIIEVIQAGGNLPAEFYQQQDKKTWALGGNNGD